MILRSVKRLNLNKKFFFIFVSLWTAYAISPVFVGPASASPARGIKNGPDLFFCDIIYKGFFPKGKGRKLMGLCNKQRAKKEEEPLSVPVLDSGLAAGSAACQWRGFALKKVKPICGKNVRRDLFSSHPIHSPPLV